MKQKLTLLLITLITTMGAWAFDVTIANDHNAQLPSIAGFGSFSGQVFTTSEASGLAGITITAASGLTIGEQYVQTSHYGYCFKMETSAASTPYRLTLHAPEGYVITGYSLACCANTKDAVHTLTSEDGSVSTVVSAPPYNSPTGPKAFNVTGLSSQETYFTISTASKANTMYIPSFSVSLQATNSVDITYNVICNGSSVTTVSAAGSKIGATPCLAGYARRQYCTYSYYSDAGCTSALTELPSANATVYAKVNFNPPFTVSSGFVGATWYKLSMRNGAKWVQMSSTTPYPNKTSKPGNVSEALWAFTGDPYNGIKVMNARAGDGYYLKKGGNSTGSAITMQKDGEAWSIGVGTSGFYLYADDTYTIDMHDYSTQLAVWWNWGAPSDAGSAFQVEAASPIKVTYKLTFNGNVISSYTKDLYELVGATAAAPFDWVLPAYCSLGACTPSTIAAETTEVTIPLNWNGPFDFSTDYEHATWYCMQINKNKWLSAGNTTEGVTSVTAGTETSTSDAALWAFIGNPYDGIKIINKATGDGCYGKAASSFTISSDDTNTLLSIVEDAKGLMFKNSAGNYMELLNTGVGFLYDTPYNNANVIVLRSYYCQKLIDDLYAWADDNHRNELFGPSETWLSDKASQVVSMFSNMSKSTYDEITVPNDFTPVIPNYPSNGYYRIKSSGQRSIGESYIGYGSSDYGTGLRTVVAANKLSDISTVIKLTGSAGTYKISTEGLNVQSQTAANSAFTATGEEGVDFVFTVSTPGVVTIRNAASAEDDRQGCLHEGQDGTSVKGVINWNPGADQSKWTVEEATSVTIPLNTVGDKSYATFSAPFDVTIGTGATAYQIDLDTERDRAVYTAIEGNKVPAGAGVLLISDSKASSVTATIRTSGSAFSALEGNELVGYFAASTYSKQDESYYNLVLGVGANNGTIGFYQMGEGTASANKAYLPYPKGGGGGVKGFALISAEELETGIENLKPTQKTESIYDLSGRRVSKPTRGLYIKNGQKISVK